MGSAPHAPRAGTGKKRSHARTYAAMAAVVVVIIFASAVTAAIPAEPPLPLATLPAAPFTTATTAGAATSHPHGTGLPGYAVPHMAAHAQADGGAAAMATETAAVAQATPYPLHAVRIGLQVAQEMLGGGDAAGAAYASSFASEQFAQGLQAFRSVDRDSTDEIHIALIDIASNMGKTGAGQSLDEIGAAITGLEAFDARDEGSRLDVVRLLTIAEEQYLEAGDGAAGNEAAYHISRMTFAKASDIFAANSDDTAMLDLEQQSFFKDLAEAVDDRRSFVTVGTLVSAIQRDLLGTETTAAREHSAYFENIRSLYEDMRASLGEGDYDSAQENAIEAYLENFEYLEPTLEKADAGFMHALEIEMREDLRGMIRERAPAPDILEFLDGTILPKLERGEAITVEYLAAEGGAATAAESGIAVADTGEGARGIGDTTESEQSEVRGEIDFIRISLEEAVILYESGDHESAYATTRSAYLDSYEYVEVPLRPIAPDFTLEVEYLFAELRNAIKRGEPASEVRSLAAQIDRNLDESERLVTGTGQVAPAIAFTASFAIIFREGLEAVLILGAIMTYLEASRNSRFKPYVHYGVAAAIGATAATWFVASYIIEISGASRELIEAVAALSATAVLFYVSFWILNKIEHKKWMEFVKAKVWQATTTGSVMVFVMLSFFTVYREGFETVLFYQAMFGFAKYMEMFVGLGFVLGLGSLFAVYYGMRVMGRRLPLRALFGLTMGIGAYLSIAFLGNAIRELQVLDVVPYTSMLGVVPRLDINLATMTGIYPTLETVVGQVVLLGIYMVASSYILIVRPRKERAVAAMRQSRRRGGDGSSDGVRTR